MVGHFQSLELTQIWWVGGDGWEKGRLIQMGNGCRCRSGNGRRELVLQTAHSVGEFEAVAEGVVSVEAADGGIERVVLD